MRDVHVKKAPHRVIPTLGHSGTGAPNRDGDGSVVARAYAWEAPAGRAREAFGDSRATLCDAAMTASCRESGGWQGDKVGSRVGAK